LAPTALSLNWRDGDREERSRNVCRGGDLHGGRAIYRGGDLEE